MLALLFIFLPMCRSCIMLRQSVMFCPHNWKCSNSTNPPAFHATLKSGNYSKLPSLSWLLSASGEGKKINIAINPNNIVTFRRSDFPPGLGLSSLSVAKNPIRIQDFDKDTFENVKETLTKLEVSDGDFNFWETEALSRLGKLTSLSISGGRPFRPALHVPFLTGPIAGSLRDLSISHFDINYIGSYFLDGLRLNNITFVDLQLTSFPNTFQYQPKLYYLTMLRAFKPGKHRVGDVICNYKYPLYHLTLKQCYISELDRGTLLLCSSLRRVDLSGNPDLSLSVEHFAERQDLYLDVSGDNMGLYDFFGRAGAALLKTFLFYHTKIACRTCRDVLKYHGVTTLRGTCIDPWFESSPIEAIMKKCLKQRNGFI